MRYNLSSLSKTMARHFCKETQCITAIILSSLINVPYGGKVWRIDSFQAFGDRKFGKLIDQSIDY